MIRAVFIQQLYTEHLPGYVGICYQAEQAQSLLTCDSWLSKGTSVIRRESRPLSLSTDPGAESLATAEPDCPLLVELPVCPVVGPAGVDAEGRPMSCSQRAPVWCSLLFVCRRGLGGARSAGHPLSSRALFCLLWPMNPFGFGKTKPHCDYCGQMRGG